MGDVHIKLGERWVKNQAMYLNGRIFTNENEFQQLSIRSNDISSVKAQLKRAQGFYAIIYMDRNHLWAATDRVRSIPLFYGSMGSDLYLSDDAYWIAEQFQATSYSFQSQVEFLLAGYVTGRETLHPKINQIQAGELLYIRDFKDCPVPVTERYFEFTHKADAYQGGSELLMLWDDVLLQSFERLIKLAQGRLLLLPLSGGLDSRVIAMMLHRLRYDNVLCFSYGLPGNSESAISRSVAEQLGFRWEFVEYSHTRWKNWYASKEFQEYMRFADRLCSVAHVQDWPAIWELSKKGLLTTDCIFIPGHTGDFLAGSHIPINLKHVKKISIDMVIDTILKRYFTLWDLQYIAERISNVTSTVQLYNGLKQKTGDLINSTSIDGFDHAVNLMEHWNWQERQSKFIVNSVRAYEFWGYDFYLPLWDLNIMDFWSKVPLENRVGKKLYKSYVQRLSSETGVFVGEDTRISEVALNHLRNVLNSRYMNQQLAYGIKSSLKRLRRTHNSKEIYEGHPLSWYGIISLEQFRRISSVVDNVNSILAADRLGLVRELFI